MHLKIRDIDLVAIKKFDEMAKKKGISRQKLLKGILEIAAYLPEQTKKEMELENLIEKNIYAMRECYSEMKKMNEFIQLMTQDDENE
ncbi:hypothetical protein P4T62_19730 [Bacillus mycoides]|uniref:hypothetical protein n=1 Tax=Bacillus mycoides TaxID=1405 RepID=UPI002E1B1674|nr:hypothetical protein [Bacillus mycoides]